MKYVEEKIETAAKSDEIVTNILKHVKTTIPSPPSTTHQDWNGTILENPTDTFFDDVPTPEPTPELKMDFTIFVESLTNSVALYMSKDQQVGKCLDEYHNVLKNTEQWVSNVDEKTLDLVNQNMFTGNVYNYTKEEGLIQQDERLVETFYYKYAYDKIDKLDFLMHFESEQHSSRIVSNINTFVDKIESRLTDPLVNRIKRVRRELETYYITALRKASVLERYLGNSVITCTIIVFLFPRQETR